MDLRKFYWENVSDGEYFYKYYDLVKKSTEHIMFFEVKRKPTIINSTCTILKKQ